MIRTLHLLRNRIAIARSAASYTHLTAGHRIGTRSDIWARTLLTGSPCCNVLLVLQLARFCALLVLFSLLFREFLPHCSKQLRQFRQFQVYCSFLVLSLTRVLITNFRAVLLRKEHIARSVLLGLRIIITLRRLAFFLLGLLLHFLLSLLGFLDLFLHFLLFLLLFILSGSVLDNLRGLFLSLKTHFKYDLKEGLNFILVVIQ